MATDRLRELLSEHAARYPKMEPTDALKLVYQMAFGPGHLLTDRAMAVAQIEAEMAEAPVTDLLLEPIGGGYARLYLGAARDGGMGADEIASAFMRAGLREGDRALFDLALLTLRDMAKDRLFAFTAEALDEVVGAWEAAGRPLFRHSQAYREAYAPAYRLIPMEESCS